MKFVMSYSCGKDSTLALHKMIEKGNCPVALVTMFNEEAERSFFHGADRKMLEAYSKSLDIPILVTSTAGESYHLAMEDSLRKAVALGAEAAVFGDLDIEDHRTWSEERCTNAGLSAVFPLWQKDRTENVRELVALGYKCVIKSIHNDLLPEAMLGKIIDEDIICQIEECGIDVCGENGEYHTLVVDGPVFKEPLRYKTGEIMNFGQVSIIDISFE